MTVRELLTFLRGAKRSGSGWLALCPAHDDHKPSLSINEGNDGRVLIHCHAGCSLEQVCAALGVDPASLWADEGRSSGNTSRNQTDESRQIVATYDYTDEQGRLLSQVVRYEPKEFRQRQPDSNGGWLWNLKRVRRVLYRLPELLAADPLSTVFVCEGEKDVDRLAALGLVATTSPQGGGKWRDEYRECLGGRHVGILSDNDNLGRDHAKQVANSLSGVAASVHILALPDLPDKGDVSDWLDAGGTAEELERLAVGAPIYDADRKTESRASRFTFTTLDDLLTEPDEEVAFVWDKTLPRGGFSICAAKPKVGKSTLARNLAVAVSRGEDFFGRATEKGKVIYLCLEEKRAEVKKHFRQMGASGADIIIHTGRTPVEALEALEAAIKEHSPALVIIDPLSRFVRVTDFNSYGEVTRELEPLIDLARESECQCHVLTLHHNGKGERESGDALLGSTGFFGAVDTLLTMKKRQVVRTLETTQRYGEDLPETVVRLETETGAVKPDGDMQTLMLKERKTAVLDSLGDESLAETDIKERVSGDKGTTSKAVRALHEEGRLTRTGAGKKGDPYRYQKATETASADSGFLGSSISLNPQNLENPQSPEWKNTDFEGVLAQTHPESSNASDEDGSLRKNSGYCGFPLNRNPENPQNPESEIAAHSVGSLSQTQPATEVFEL